MAKHMSVVLMFFIGVLAGSDAFPMASATIGVGSAGNIFVLGSNPLSRSSTGWDVTIYAKSIPVPFGETVISIPYTMTVTDEGLQADPPDPSFFTLACVPLGGTSRKCPPPYTGNELALATVGVLPTSRGDDSMYVDITFAPFLGTLQTQGDTFAEDLSLSGSIDVLVRNGTPFGPGLNAANFTLYAAVWVYANPIPEPATWALMAAGLGLLARPRRSTRYRLTVRKGEGRVVAMLPAPDLTAPCRHLSVERAEGHAEDPR